MDIYSESKLLTDKEIEKVISLLHPIYTDLDIEIKLYTTESSCLDHNWEWLGTLPIDVRIDFLNCVNEYLAFADLEFGKIFLFEDKMIAECKEEYYKNESEECPEEWIKIHMIYTLLHELRHAWQNEYKTHYTLLEDIEITWDQYMGMKHERDADRFASIMMNKFRNEINKMCGFDEKWYWIHAWYWIKENYK